MGRKDSYRFAEKCLYEYLPNCAKLEALKAELELVRRAGDLRGHSYEVGGNVQGSHSDPVSSYIERLEALEHEIKRLVRYTEPVGRFREDVSCSNVKGSSKKKDYHQILELYYFGGNRPKEIVSQLHCSRSVFYERRKALVQMAMKYLGLS